MKFVVVKVGKKYLLILGAVIILILLVLITFYRQGIPSAKMVMGGSYSPQVFEDYDGRPLKRDVNPEEYIRPSKLPVINTRFAGADFFNQYYGKNPNQIKLPDNFFKTPEDMLLNYFSILRDAANGGDNEYTGCGTIGYGNLPYPVAYNFLSSSYKEKLSYSKYLKSFDGILHTSLLKLKKVPMFNPPQNTYRYFVEFETIHGSKDKAGHFAYYYGFIDVVKENNLYKISDMNFTGEVYLCAPMHGWDYLGEYVVDIKYGNWCHLVDKRYSSKLEGYVKNVFFKGTDGFDYMIEFYRLTNDTDVEIAQYRKSSEGEYKLIKLDPEKCLDKKTN